MEMVLSNGFCELSFNEAMIIDGGNETADAVCKVIGQIVGGALGLLYDAAVVYRAVMTGSWV